MTEAEGVRQFSGVAYSGGLLSHGYWGQVIFDLSTTQCAEKTPMLLEHNRDKRIGFTKTVDINNQISIEGILLSNPDALALIKDADEGFPFQQSVHIDPANIRQIAEGVMETINGIEVTGPATVFENSTIREISFTPTGVDANTPTKIFSLNQDKFMPDNKEELAALNTQVSELKASVDAATLRAETAETALADNQKQQREYAIGDLEKVLDKTFSDEEKTTLFSLDAAGFKLFSSQAKPAAQTPNIPYSFFSASSAPAGAAGPGCAAGPVAAPGHRGAWHPAAAAGHRCAWRCSGLAFAAHQVVEEQQHDGTKDGGDPAGAAAGRVPAHGGAGIAGQHRADHAQHDGHDPAHAVIARFEGAGNQAHDESDQQGS